MASQAEHVQRPRPQMPVEEMGLQYSSDSDDDVDGDDNAVVDSALHSYADQGLKLLEVIGSGAYGVVYRAIWHGQVVAAKVIDHEGGADEEGGTLNEGGSFCPFGRETGPSGEAPMNTSLMEGELSLIMQHPNIVRSLAYEAVPKRVPTDGATHEIRLIMEYCDRGSLDKAVAAGCFHEVVDGVLRINMEALLKTLLEAAYAMRHLHSMHILHRDLKIQNILLKSSNKDMRGFTVKVSDFGLARIWDGRGRGHSPSERHKYVGTVTHMAPELIERGEVSTACDVYAFGILMWECFTRLTPYKGLGPPQVLVGVVSSRLRPAFCSATAPGFRDLARWCWAHEAEQRPTFSQIAKFLHLLLEEEQR